MIHDPEVLPITSMAVPDGMTVRIEADRLPVALRFKAAVVTARTGLVLAVSLIRYSVAI